MEERKQQPHALQWHPAFYAGIQIELEAEADLLLFENEHQLGTKPKEIDVLIVKKERDVSIRKNIGRIFRTHNIVEYLSDFFCYPHFFSHNIIPRNRKDKLRIRFPAAFSNDIRIFQCMGKKILL